MPKNNIIAVAVRDEKAFAQIVSMSSDASEEQIKLHVKEAFPDGWRVFTCETSPTEADVKAAIKAALAGKPVESKGVSDYQPLTVDAQQEKA